MAELNIVDTGPGGAVGQIQTPYLQTLVPGYSFGMGNGYLEFGSGTPGSLPFRVDQDGNVTAAAVNASITGGLAPSGDTSGATDSAAIQALLTANKGPVVLAAGQFYIDAALTLATGNTLRGSGMDSTVINQVSTTAHCLTMTDQRYITVRDLMLSGPGSGSGAGIYFTYSASALASLDLENIRVTGTGSYGVYLNTAITSTLRNVRVENSGADNFHLIGGTSCVLDACYADGNTVTTANGFYLYQMTYCALNGCGADSIVGNGSSGGAGYQINDSANIALNGCGNEASAIGFEISDGSHSCTLNSCYVSAETEYAFWVTGSSTNIVFSACRENNPNSATASFIVASGSKVCNIMPGYSTAESYASGTAYEILYTGGTAH